MENENPNENPISEEPEEAEAPQESPAPEAPGEQNAPEEIPEESPIETPEEPAAEVEPEEPAEAPASPEKEEAEARYNEVMAEYESAVEEAAQLVNAGKEELAGWVADFAKESNADPKMFAKSIALGGQKDKIAALAQIVKTLADADLRIKDGYKARLQSLEA